MKKRLLTILAVLLLVLANSAFAFADTDTEKAAPKDYMVDNAQLLTDSEEAEIEQILAQKSAELKFDIAVLTVDSTDGLDISAYADDYYDYGGYGYGKEHDGCILVVDMGSRQYWISTTGFGITALTDAGLEYIQNKFTSALSDGFYADTFEIFADQVDLFVQQARTGEPYDVGNMPKHHRSFSLMFPVAGIIAGLIAGAGTTKGMKGKLKSVRYQSSAKNYLKDGSLKLSVKQDNFITASVTRQKKETENKGGGGSSTHTGSSGTSHGGSGGSF